MPNNVMEKMPGRNGGQLNKGGTPGNKGGGRLPDDLKAKYFDAGDKAIGILLDRMAASPDDFTSADLARVAEIAGKYNLATKQEFEDKTPSPEEAARRIAKALNGRQDQ